MLADFKKLLFKLILVGLPFFVLFIVISIPTPFADYISRARMQDKVEQLVLSTSTPTDILIDGDSRAEANIIPSVFEAATGKSAADVAVGGTSLTEAYSVLSANGLLKHKPILIMSVSFYDITDAQFDVQHNDLAVIRAEPWGIEKVKDLALYYKAYVGYYVIHFKNVLRFAATDNIHMSHDELATKGYPVPHGMVDIEKTDITTFPNSNWYANVRLGGVHQAQFVKSLQELGESGTPILLYIGPTAPFWSGSAKDPSTNAPDKAFADLIETTVAPYRNIHFVNFEAHPIPALTDKEFVDRLHLSQDGATLFTKTLVGILRADRILH